jgi:methyl-accepting chemotaxis protein
VDSAIGAVDEIVAVIRQISDMSDTIAVAVEEQTATTSELSTNAQTTGETVVHMEDMIRDITTASDQSDAGAQRVKESAEQLKTLYGKLEELLNEFKV